MWGKSPLEHRRYDQSDYEPFWAAAAALDLPLSLHTATRRQGRIRGAGDLIFSGVFERNSGTNARLPIMPDLAGLGSVAGTPMHSVDFVRTVFHRS